MSPRSAGELEEMEKMLAGAKRGQTEGEKVMLVVVCLDAKSGKCRATGLQFLRRYEVKAEESISDTCVYCGEACSKIDVGVGGGGWCRKRFALAPPGNDNHLEIARELVDSGV